MRAWATGVFFGVLLGCSPGVSNGRGSELLLRDAEYSVYSHLVRKHRDELHVRVADSTDNGGFVQAPLCADGERGLGCHTRQPSMSIEAFDDHLRKNRKRWPILPLFEKDIAAPLVRNAEQIEVTCRQPTVIHFSRPGFNRELTQAVVHVVVITGKGPMPGCGVAQGYGLVLERTATGWRAIAPLGGFIT